MPDVRDDVHLLRLVGPGHQFFAGYGALVKIVLAQAVGRVDFELVGVLVEDPDKGVLGIQSLGGLLGQQLQDFF